MARKYDDYDDGFEVKRRAYEDEEPLFQEGRKPLRRRTASEPEVKKAPLIVRLIAWVAVIAFCFVAGYVGTSLALRMLNKKDLLLRPDVASNRQEATGIIEDGASEIRVNARKVAFTVFYPKDGGLSSEGVELLSGIMEDDIRAVFGRLLSLVPGVFSSEMKILHVFRSGDTLFLDLNSPFASGLSKIGEAESALLITAIVRTVAENFPPLIKVRFLINGQVARGDAPVDLTAPWQLPQ